MNRNNGTWTTKTQRGWSPAPRYGRNRCKDAACSVSTSCNSIPQGRYPVTRYLLPVFTNGLLIKKMDQVIRLMMWGVSSATTEVVLLLK